MYTHLLPLLYRLCISVSTLFTGFLLHSNRHAYMSRLLPSGYCSHKYHFFLKNRERFQFSHRLTVTETT